MPLSNVAMLGCGPALPTHGLGPTGGQLRHPWGYITAGLGAVAVVPGTSTLPHSSIAPNHQRAHVERKVGAKDDLPRTFEMLIQRFLITIVALKFEGQFQFRPVLTELWS